MAKAARLAVTGEPWLRLARIQLDQGEWAAARDSLKAGLANWEYTEVLEGLAEGDRVVTSLDRAGVKAGARVTIEPAPAK